MAKAVILLAGGGTGGHIYPNIAIAERLSELCSENKALAIEAHFLVSERPGDRQILERFDLSFSTTPVKPLPPLSRPWRLVPFLLAWNRAVRRARALLAQRSVAAVVATGGFVSGPAVVAATRAGIPCALLNLDAIPGVANRRLARYEPTLFSVYPSPALPGARAIGLPLRRASLGSAAAVAEPSEEDEQRLRSEARRALGLAADKPVLFITGATHGAESIIRAMIELTASSEHRDILAGWQVFHQCGTFPTDELQQAYDRADIPAVVVSYCDAMGTAWQAADAAVSRAGAGSVAEAWANGTPTLFLPNPYHRDQHQRHNAQPVVAAGGAILLEDRVDPSANLPGLARTLGALLGDPARREDMRAALRSSRPADGAGLVAQWLSTACS